MLRVFNTLSRKKEEFKPLKGNAVGIYTCGPSVYQKPHIGNYRTYVFEDVFKRYLKWKGFRVNHVMNITDVENKAIAEARRQGKSLHALTRYYEKLFFCDIKKLGVLLADAYPRATETIPEIAALVRELAKKGMAYNVGGDWFFDVSKFKTYGMLSRLRHRIRKGNRVSSDDYEKWQAGNFILWRKWRKADGSVYWKTGVGKGRPGWSIECTAMGRKFLGDEYDVKMGGVDNIFCHHENEIAQAWGVSGKIFAKYFVHVKHLLINGEKMSKSLGNVVYLEDVEKKGIEATALRLFYLGQHYRKRVSFTWKKLKKVQEQLEECRECVKKMKNACKRDAKANAEVGEAARRAREEFTKFMDDDFQTQKALETVCGLVKFALAKPKEGVSCTDAKLVLSALNEFDEVLGLGIF